METVPLADSDTDEVVTGVHLTQLAAGDRTSLQHFRIDPGAGVEEHSHHHEQTGYVVQGALTFEVGGEEIVVGAGESFSIPSEEPHAAENRGDEPVVGVETFSPARPVPPWAEA